MVAAEQLTERLGALFAETFRVKAPGPDSDLLDEGILDSFQFVELLVQIEKRFALRIDIGDVDLDELRTLDRLARMVLRKAGAPARAATVPGLALNGEP